MWYDRMVGRVKKAVSSPTRKIKFVASFRTAWEVTDMICGEREKINKVGLGLDSVKKTVVRWFWTEYHFSDRPEMLIGKGCMNTLLMITLNG